MLPLSLIVFFTSGFAALLYQITWQRLLAVFSGADVYSATVVIAAFMAGLGCGSLAGGHVADRVSPRTSLLLFMGAESGIALFGLQSQAILYDTLYQQLGHLAQAPTMAGAVLFGVLVWPTSLMGASLPLLARAVTRTIDKAAATIGWLYAANTLGAAVGALAATWWFLPLEGLSGTATVAAKLNLACAAGALPVLAVGWRRRWRPSMAVAPPAATAEASSLSAEAVSRSSRLSFRTWAILYTLAGFLALSLEITWFRVLGVMLKSSAFTFGTLLAQFLFWLGLGSALGSLVARWLKQPATWFLVIQCVATLYAGVSLAIVVDQLPEWPQLAWLYRYLGTYEPIEMASAVGQIRRFINDWIWHSVTAKDLPQLFLALYFVVPAMMIGPATLLMGFSFPVLQRVVQTDLAYLGRRVGTLLLCNIVGSTLGTIVTGWMLLAWLGTAGTLKTLVALSSLFALVAASGARRPLVARVGAATVIATVVATVVAMPSRVELWARLHGTSASKVLVAEDGSGLSLLKPAGEYFGQGAAFFVNGLGQSRIPYGGIHTILGVLPVLIHPDPREIAVIGLGSGDTVYGAAGWPSVERIYSIEIVKPQLDTLHALSRVRHDPALSGLLSDSRITHVFADGRRFIKHGGRKFDIIEADALRPESAFSGNLYSDAYFKLLQEHLRPGGLAVTWSPSDRVERTFASVFPYVLIFEGVLIGSNDPIVFDRDAIARRLADENYQQYFWRAGVDIRRLLEGQLETGRPLVIDPAEQADVNTDVFPRDELNIPKLFDLYMLRPEGSR